MLGSNSGRSIFGKVLSSTASGLRGAFGGKSPAERVSEIIHPDALSYTYYTPGLDVLMSWSKASQFAGLVRLNQPLQRGNQSIHCGS